LTRAIRTLTVAVWCLCTLVPLMKLRAMIQAGGS
jgi:hypothetical protein